MTLAGMLVDLFDLSHVTCRMLAAHALWADVCSSCAAACSRFSMGQTRGPRPFFISLSFVGLLHDESNCVWHVWFVMGFPPFFFSNVSTGAPRDVRQVSVILSCVATPMAQVYNVDCASLDHLFWLGIDAQAGAIVPGTHFTCAFPLYDFMMFHVLSVLLWHSLVFRPPYCPALGDWVECVILFFRLERLHVQPAWIDMPEMFRSSRAETLIGGVCRSGQSLQLGRHTMCMAGFHAHSFFFKRHMYVDVWDGNGDRARLWQEDSWFENS